MAKKAPRVALSIAKEVAKVHCNSRVSLFCKSLLSLTITTHLLTHTPFFGLYSTPEVAAYLSN